MKITGEYFLILGFMLVVLPLTARAEFGFEVSRDLSATANAGQVSLLYSREAFVDKETDIVGLMNNWQYDYSGSVANVNLNSALSDFEIKTQSHELSYDMNFYETLTLSLKAMLKTYNVDEARQSLFSIGTYYQLGDFQVGLVGTTADTNQIQDVEILGTNYRDDIKFNRRSSSYYVSYSFTKSLMASLNYTQYTYDKNLDNSYALLTTIPFLNRGTAAVANEISSQLKNSFDLTTSFIAGGGWLLTFGVGQSQEALSPAAKSNNVSVGADYELVRPEARYRVFAIFDVGKTPDVDGSSNSGQIGFGINY